MRIYAVFERRAASEDGGEDVTLVNEGFCWPAMLFGPIWALGHQMWVVTAGVATAWTLIGMLLLIRSEFLVFLTAAAVMGFEGNDLRRWTLGLRGYEFSGVVSGRNLADAERRLFAAVDPIFYRK